MLTPFRELYYHFEKIICVLQLTSPLQYRTKMTNACVLVLLIGVYLTLAASK